MKAESIVGITLISPKRYRELFTITPDRRVLIPGDLYEAARGFWEIVKEIAPEGWKVEKVG